MVSRTAYLRYVEGVGTDSLETLVGTLTRLWAGALGIPAAAKEMASWTSH